MNVHVPLNPTPILEKQHIVVHVNHRLLREYHIWDLEGRFMLKISNEAMRVFSCVAQQLMFFTQNEHEQECKEYDIEQMLSDLYLNMKGKIIEHGH
jgi:hypothetical protein